MPDSLPPETLAWLRQTAKFEVNPQALLHLLDRVEVLGHRPTCKEFLQVPPIPEAAPVATDAEIREYAGERFPMCLRGAYNLGRQHGAAQPPAAQPVPPVAPAGGLVERVAEVILTASRGSTEDWIPEACAAIREVAAWMRESQTGLNAARWLEQEANQ
jgi:hypothetical protein